MENNNIKKQPENTDWDSFIDWNISMLVNLAMAQITQVLVAQSLQSFLKTIEEEKEHKYWQELIEQAGEPK